MVEKYLQYDIDDFIQDDSFINWVLSDQSPDADMWEQLQAHSSDLQHNILKSKQIVLALNQVDHSGLMSNMEEELWGNIDQEISAPKGREIKPHFSKHLLRLAASILLLVSTGFYLLNSNSFNQDKKHSTNQEWNNIENTDGISMHILLPDNSQVILEPFSSLKYPTHFTQEQRTVFLKGEAFFDIQRDTLRPFLVYANETITKVLGTSFRIKAYEGQETVEVDVKTGKVAVYAKVASDKKQPEKRIILQTDEEIIVPLPNKKLEVTPNHRVVFDRKVEDLTRRITPIPIVIKEIESLPQVSFKNEPVAKVFHAISQIYGVELYFDEHDLTDCVITTKLKDEPLYQVLEILCTALNLNFQEVDAAINITGQGCH